MLKLMKISRRTNHRRNLKAPTSPAADNIDPNDEVRKLFQRFWRRQVKGHKDKSAFSP